jgi:glycosyltransferase involved in cell wall biosynthesis
MAGEQLKLSVVIATLGGPSLPETVEGLMQGDRVPDEILICIPDDRLPSVEYLQNDVVKIICTGAKGQVRQRAVGFSKARYPLVMQLDDDIAFDKTSIAALERLLLNKGKGYAIGPVYYGKISRRCIHTMEKGVAAFISNLFDLLICGARWGNAKMGTVSVIGLNYGVDDTRISGSYVPVEWLPGGCVICFREDLITEDFFPFEGKAYCEDVFHAWYRQQKGISMIVCKEARAWIDDIVPELSSAAVEKVITIRRKLVTMMKGPLWRLRIYETFARLRSRWYDKRRTA